MNSNFGAIHAISHKRDVKDFFTEDAESSFTSSGKNSESLRHTELLSAENKKLQLLGLKRKKIYQNLKENQLDIFSDREASLEILKAGLLCKTNTKTIGTKALKDKKNCERKNTQHTLSQEYLNLSSDGNSELYICDFCNCLKKFKDIKKYNQHKKCHLKKLLEKMFDINSDEDDQGFTTEDSNAKDKIFIHNKQAVKLEANIMNLQAKMDFLM